MAQIKPFTTVFGRGLLEEVRYISAPCAVLVTMKDLWSMEKFRSKFVKEDNCHTEFIIYCVESLDAETLQKELQTLVEKHGKINTIVGFGGGQAIDVAKFFSWTLGGVPLFQIPTALTVDAPWGHRAAIRYDGIVRYVGFAVPSAVYIDYDVIMSAPKRLNVSGVADVLCFHTAHHDWALAEKHKEAGNWPYDSEVVAEAQSRLQALLNNLEEVQNMTEKGIRTLVQAFQYGGAAFHAYGWNPRPLEGFDHLFFYALEHRTGKHFIHGYPVALGIWLGSLLQKNDPEMVIMVVKKCGIDIRPEAMGITWSDVEDTLKGLASFVKENKYMFTIGSIAEFSSEWLQETKDKLYDNYKDWES
eukprot:m.341614 g.341614  ORF g.341614 m.341614 type:complete len:359 (-) comp20260_c0_seq1:44-1120(-)